MTRRLTPATFAIILFSLLSGARANAQIKIDISSDDARKAANETTIDDLAVHDTAFIYANFCINNGGLYVPGWTRPANLASDTYAATGIVLRVEILPAKKLKGTWVDAAQTQLVAKGNPKSPPVLSKDTYNRHVINAINSIFSGGSWGINACDDDQRANPLRKLTLYAVDSINGFSKISELLASAQSTK